MFKRKNSFEVAICSIFWNRYLTCCNWWICWIFKIKAILSPFCVCIYFHCIEFAHEKSCIVNFAPPQKVLLYSPYVSVLKITRRCFLLECDGWFFKNRVFCIGERLSFNSTKDKLFTEGHNLCLNFTIRLVHPPCICFVVRPW